MSEKKKHFYVNLPVKLANEISVLVGPRGRSAFFTEILEKEVDKRRTRVVSEADEAVCPNDDRLTD